MIIALNAIGKNPQDVAGYDLVGKLNNYDKVINQGINGAAYALIALNTGDYASEEMEGKLLEYIKANELDNGGFSLGQENADPDITAMVLQALAGYQDNEEIKAIIDRGLNKLSTMQNEKGGYNTNSSESISQVITALKKLNIDTEIDSRFIKNEYTLIDALYSYYDEETGAFRHTLDGEANLMASEQVLIALS